MKNKKIVAGLLALTFVFGGAVLPNAAKNNTVISASAGGIQVDGVYEDIFQYAYLEDDTVEIVGLLGRYGEDYQDLYVPEEIEGYPVSSIGEYAFASTKVDRVILPETVKNIGDSAFENSKLVSIEMPYYLKTIGMSAFSGCKNLESIDIPERVTSILYRTFADCDSLVNVELSDEVTFIAESAFEGCDNLESVRIPNEIDMICEAAFKNCKSLKSVTIPESVTAIDADTFNGCKSLKNVNLPDTLEVIRSNAFANCTSLETIYLPDQLVSIGDGAFFGCTKLKNVYITDNVSSIGADAFYYRNRIENEIRPLENITIYCYRNSYAEEYANSYYLPYRYVNYYPEVTKIDYNEEFHQFRVKWTEVPCAEQYAIAVKLAGKWKVQTYTAKNYFTSPKLKAKSKYSMVICAKIDGEWDTSNISGRAFTVTVK